jgi:hypothetical protein
MHYHWTGANNIMTVGCDHFKTSTLTRHAASADHQKTIIAPKERSNLSTSVNRVCNKEESAITVALKSVYFLAQEGIALSKYTNMIKFLKEVGTPNLNSLNVNKRADYSSYNTAVDLLTALSDVIDEHIFFKNSMNLQFSQF